MSVDYADLSVVVVGHTRRDRLQHTLDQLEMTLPEYRAIYVVANHPTTLDGIRLLFRTTPLPTSRVPEHEGNLTESWNLGMQWVFRDPAIEWCLCCQDDVELVSGWPASVARETRTCTSLRAGTPSFCSTVGCFGKSDGSTSDFGGSAFTSGIGRPGRSSGSGKTGSSSRISTDGISTRWDWTSNG